MDYQWIDIKKDGILRVPDIPDSVPREHPADYMWLTINGRDELAGFPVCDKYETGWWAKMKRWYSKPIVTFSCLWPGNDDIAPWTRTTDRMPVGDRFVLVLDHDSYDMSFEAAADIRPDRELYWYDDDISATLFKRRNHD